MPGTVGDEMKEQGDDDREEEILHPSWRKSGFGIQLEVHSRDISLNRAVVTHSTVTVVATDDDVGPFLPSTYSGAEMVLGNPWTEKDESKEISSMLSADARRGAKPDAEERGFAKEDGSLAHPAGTIPYVEDTPPEAVPDGKHRGDAKSEEDEDGKISPSEGKHSRDGRDSYYGGTFSEEKSSDDAKFTSDAKFDAKGDKP